MKKKWNIIFLSAIMLFLFNTTNSHLKAQNKNLSNAFSFNGEPFLMVNPTNAKHIIVAWMGFSFGNNIVIKTRTSTDAGLTWSAATNLPHATNGNTSADPSMDFDANGNLYLCYVDFNQATSSGAVLVAKSTNGGLSWGTPVEALNANADGTKLPIDRPWMVIDKSTGPTSGTIYITTKPAPWIPAPNRAYLVTSTNGGTVWQPWKYIDGTNNLIGNFIAAPMAAPTVSASGVFYAAYPSFVFTQNTLPQIILASSTDGGNTLNYQSVINVVSNNNDTLPKKGFSLISNPANANHLLMVYVNDNFGDLDVFIAETFDAGATWTTPIRVNDDPLSNNRIQDLVWADFDADGDLVVAWRDRRNASDTTYTTSSEIYAAVRWNGNALFSPNFMLTDSSISYNTILAQNGNDFMGVAIANDTLYSAWGDPRNGFLNVWFQRKDLQNGTTFTTELANNLLPISIYPNPTNDVVFLDLGDNDIKNVSVAIYAINGKLLLQETIHQKTHRFSLKDYPKGNYLMKIETKEGSTIKKIIVGE